MKHKKYVFSLIFMMIFILINGLSFADQERDKDKRKYEVTITNLTRGQIFSPPIVIAHDRHFSLFTLGEEPSDQLAPLAEDGDTGPLVELIKEKYPYAFDGTMVHPGESVYLQLEIGKRSRLEWISVAGMLVTTNDAFFAAHDVWFLGKKNVMVEASAYDAGSEVNTESCDHIPGPPCGSPGVRVTDGAEGFVHVHRGIRGVGDLDASAKDWRNPVARILIQRN